MVTMARNAAVIVVVIMVVVLDITIARVMPYEWDERNGLVHGFA